MNWDALWHLPGTKTLPNGRMHGLGMYETRGWDDSGGIGNGAIRIEENEGTATLLSLRCDCGTNEETGYCQVVADELGFNITDVAYRCFKDPGFRTFTPDTSTNTSLGAYVFRNAARTLKINILDRATRDFVTQWHTLYKAAFPGKTPEQLDIKNSAIYEIANPSNSMTMKAFTQYVQGSPEPMFASGWQSQNGTYSEIRQHFVRQAHFMEVEVDTETGQVFVTNMASCNDVGKVVSPEGAADQCYGGSTMGTSRSLMEEVIWDPQTGACLNSNGYDYKLLTLLDCPPITPIIIETAQGFGPYGISGLGESNGSIECMTALAVNNAIGKWVDRPTTPERVLKALGKA
jgi:xanthine dehydrogenase molybdenum-binding subunit